MNIDEEIRDGVTILRVCGNVMSRPDVAHFHNRVKHLAEAGSTKVVVDLSKAKLFGAAMLGILAASQKTLRCAGGGLRVVGITKRLDRMITVSHLESRLQTLGTVDRALTSFGDCKRALLEGGSDSYVCCRTSVRDVTSSAAKRGTGDGRRDQAFCRSRNRENRYCGPENVSSLREKEAGCASL